MHRILLHIARHASLMVLASLALLLLPVSAQSLPSTPVPEGMHDVVDEFGRTVRVPRVPSRIVTLAPSLTETIYALGAQDRLVGDTDFCDYPPDAQKKAKVGGAINPNLEEIAALHPDLVLVTKELNRMDTVRALETLGIPAYATDARTVEEILSTTQKLADLLGVSAAGQTLVAELRSRLAALHARLQGVPPAHVLFVVWAEPLISVGKNTFIADALRHAGAVSVIDSSQDWPQVSLEEVVHLQPEYLVFAESHSEAGSHDFDTLADRPGWRILDAVRNRHFAVISEAVNRPAPRIVSAIEDLARQLHPAAFPEAPASAQQVPQMLPPTNAHPASTPPLIALAVLPSAQEIACAR